eukprot:6064913-Pyramimonas_sp.AAC.1
MGWAVGLREVIEALYAGKEVKWDLSKLRPAGARLKIMGGRASGPEPLKSLLEFATNLVAGARGRKLTPLECHDLMCKVRAPA